MDDDVLTYTLCSWLDAAGLGAFNRAAAGRPVIFYGPLGETPDEALGVTAYGTEDDVAIGTATRYVQVRYRGARGDVRGANKLAGLGFTALHGEHHRGGIARVRRISSAPWGADENDRQERTDNFEIILNTAPAPGGTP